MTTPLAALTMLTALILVASAGLVVTIDGDRGPAQSDDRSRIPARILYTTHSPISITGNSEFTAANGVIAGNGSSSNPYIISGWEIAAGVSDFAAVFISNTDAFFRLENCSLIHDDGNAIELDYVWNGVLVNNTCTQSMSGVGIAFSHRVSIVNNTLSGNDVGISMSASNEVVIRGNNCSYNSYHGISLGGSSSFNTISDNSCSWHNTSGFVMNSGISIEGSGNFVANNTCQGNLWEGIMVSGTGNLLTNNVCTANGRNAILVLSSMGNALIGNICSGGMDSNVTGGNDGGILLDASSWSSVVDNVCTNAQAGILIRSGANNVVVDNYCSNNTLAGIYMDSWDATAQWNTISNNTCLNNSHGIMFWQWSGNNTLIGNNCSENSIYGIYLAYSRDNILTDNVCSFNLGYGMYVVNGESTVDNCISRNNTIWNNTFTGNNGASDTYNPSHVQAYDGGVDNRWNSTDGYGNWWSDLTVPDMDMNGIVDIPYDLAGDAGAEDNYPRTDTQAPIPEFGMLPLVMVMILALALITRTLRR